MQDVRRRLKLARDPRSLAATLAALPSISLFPFSSIAQIYQILVFLMSSFLRLSTFVLRHFQIIRDIRTTTDGNRRSWRKFFVRPRDR